jgi:hypothetical protein
MITIINLFLSSVKWICYLIDENIGNKKNKFRHPILLSNPHEQEVSKQEFISFEERLLNKNYIYQKI